MNWITNQWEVLNTDDYASERQYGYIMIYDFVL